MQRAEIYIEDHEVNGVVGANIRFVFPDGFKAESPSHQLTNIIRMKLDEMNKAGELQALDERTDQGDMSAADEHLEQVATAG